MVTLLLIIWLIIQVAVGYHLLIPFILSIIYLTVRNPKEKNKQNISQQEPDYAIIITAYEYTHTLSQTIQSASNLNYNNFLIYVVADNCDVSSLNFTDSRVVILKPEIILKSNIKSHFYAIERFKRNHDRLTIIDSDNVIHPEFLNGLNQYFDRGFEAVQGLRAAKNLDTIYARLDAARDIYYHHFDGKLLFNCGSSATLSGSGMAFTLALYKECLQYENISWAGFDKVLQAKIVLNNKRIAFAPEAIVYDEKTSRADQLVNQRSRWINTWFKYFTFGFELVVSGIKTHSFNQLLFGIILLRPPLFLFLLLSFFLMMANLFILPYVSFIWVIAFLLFIGSFLKALLVSNTDRRIYESLIGVPKFMFLQIVSLTKIRKANTRSVSTKHHHS